MTHATPSTIVEPIVANVDEWRAVNPQHLQPFVAATGIPEAILPVVGDGGWDLYVVNEVRDWIAALDDASHARVVAAIDLLAEHGPGLGRPLVDTIRGSTMANLKELRPGTVRILFAFDPWRSSILLVAGDKAGQWNSWYDEAIALAEQRYETYLKERTDEEGGKP